MSCTLVIKLEEKPGILAQREDRDTLGGSLEPQREVPTFWLFPYDRAQVQFRDSTFPRREDKRKARGVSYRVGTDRRMWG